MFYNIISAGGDRNPNEKDLVQPFDNSFCSDLSSCEPTKRNICFQYVNPNLLLEWEGNSKKNGINTNQITGSGTFRAYERSKDGNHKSKLVLSLEADKWKQGKPSGEIKFMEVFFYDECSRKDNVVKEIRKFVGKIQNMMKQGPGSYTIQYFCSNQTKQTIEIQGTWEKDMIVQATIKENGKIKKNPSFINNIQMRIGFSALGSSLCLPRNQIQNKSNESNDIGPIKIEPEILMNKQKNQVKQTKQSKISVNSLSLPQSNYQKKKGVRV